jgi:hypothetical protein
MNYKKQIKNNRQKKAANLGKLKTENGKRKDERLKPLCGWWWVMGGDCLEIAL